MKPINKRLQGKHAPKDPKERLKCEYGRKFFSWTEEETALLLKVALEHKTAKLAEGKSWQTIRANTSIWLQHSQIRI